MPSRLLLTTLRSSLEVSSKRAYSTASRLPLAYELHEPPKGADIKHAPIIFMHGLFGSKKNNRSISKVLARDLGRAIYAVDLRNHGDSPHNPRHDYSAMAQDIAGFIDEHKLSQTTLIGHSMGAKTAMTLALQQPELITSVVSVDNAPVDVALLSEFPKYIQGMRKVDEAGVTRQSEADKILQDYEEQLVIRQFLMGNLHRPAGEKTLKFKVPLKTLGDSMDHLGDFPFKDPDVARYEKPILFVRGTKSKYIADEALPLIGRFFPRFQLADIDAGHWVISEKPEEFRKAVVEFLQPEE